MGIQRDASKGKRTSPPIGSAQQEFLFVDAAKAKSSKLGRRDARSFVMQKARRERPWSTSKHAAKQRKSPGNQSPTPLGTPNLSTTSVTSTPSPPLVYPGTQYFPLIDSNTSLVVKQELCPECQIFICRPGQHLCPVCLPLRFPTPIEEPDNGSFDPFGTMPVGMDRGISELLNHFVKEMVPGIIAVDIRNTSRLMQSHWFGTALSDEGFMHSLLSTVALHRHVLGRGPIEPVFYHNARAILSVNNALASPDTDLGISDANIGAVFNLLTVEESLAAPWFEYLRPHGEDLNQRATHLKGLLKMVELRGGLMAMNSNRILQAFILWHATTHAVASFEVPYLSTSDLVSAACNRRHPDYQPHISPHLLDCCEKAQVSENLTTLVESALILIADLNAWFEDPMSPLDPLDIQNFSCVLECRLLKWLRDSETLLRPLEDALCIALLIFTVRTTEAFQGRNEDHMLHLQASGRLEKALKATSCTEWHSCPDLLLWILVIGAISAEGLTSGSWFAHQISLACLEFNSSDADALLDRLHRCGWVRFKLDKAVGCLWERIIDLRIEPFFDDSSMSGPLQGTVASPDFTDWQNIDWPAWNTTTEGSISVENFMGSPFYSDLFESGTEFAFPDYSTFDMSQHCNLVHRQGYHSQVMAASGSG